MDKIILLGCGSKKGNKRAEAKDLYVGPLFKNSLAYAQTLKADKIFILSALHYLVELDKKIDPYNVTLSNIPKNKRKKGLKVLCPKEKQEWGKKVIEQLKRKADLQNDQFIILAGQEYIKPISSHISNFKIPLRGLRIGERIKLMQNT